MINIHGSAVMLECFWHITGEAQEYEDNRERRGALL